jgi:hypothetical protein
MYIFSLLVFGFLQIWILAIYLLFKDVPYGFWQLIGDGGLFIFASSLTASSLLQHQKIFNLVGHKEIYWSFIFMFIIVMICFIGFSSGIDIETERPFKIVLNTTQNWAQIVSAFLSIIYGFIIEKRVQQFIKN